MTQAVKRACDACHRRKVKCDGINPCRNCSSAGLGCTYNAIPQKKGPKGSRAKVISELRETQRLTSLSAKVQNRMNGVLPPTINPSLNPTPGLLPNDLIRSCINFYFDNLYSQLPILERNLLEGQVQYMEQNRDSYCLLTSLCAFIMLQPGMTMPPGDPYNLDMNPGASIISSNLLLEECLRVRKGTDCHDAINLNVLATNVFIYGCYYGLEMHDKAWYYLREATTMVHMVGMNKEEHYAQFDNSVEPVRRRRLFWLLFITERSYAIQRHHPLTLQATIHPSSMGDDPTDGIFPDLQVFFLQCDLFRSMDDAFLATWRHGCRHLDAQHVTGLQKQLQDRSNTYSTDSSYMADQQWLKNTLWQLTGNGEDSMAFQYTVNVARDLVANMLSSFPNQGMELMGSGLIPKLLETCLNLIIVLATLPQPRDPYTLGPRQWLSQLLSIIDTIRSNDFRFVPLLLSKVNEVLPRVVNPMLQIVPENTQFKMVDMFDGFGNAGMAQMPMDDYNQGLPVDEYETKYQDMSGNSPDSLPNSNASNGTPPGPQPGNEMGAPFVSSPGNVMSPGMEYSQNMAGFNIPDMVMSPIGGAAPPNPMNNIQQQQQQPIGNQPQIQGMHNQNVNNPAMTPSMTPMYDVRQPQRQTSFQMQSQTPLSAMGSISTEMDFGSIQ